MFARGVAALCAVALIATSVQALQSTDCTDATMATVQPSGQVPTTCIKASAQSTITFHVTPHDARGGKFSILMWNIAQAPGFDVTGQLDGLTLTSETQTLTNSGGVVFGTVITGVQLEAGDHSFTTAGTTSFNFGFVVISDPQGQGFNFVTGGLATDSTATFAVLGTDTLKVPITDPFVYNRQRMAEVRVTVSSDFPAASIGTSSLNGATTGTTQVDGSTIVFSNLRLVNWAAEFRMLAANLPADWTASVFYTGTLSMVASAYPVLGDSWTSVDLASGSETIFVVPRPANWNNISVAISTTADHADGAVYTSQFVQTALEGSSWSTTPTQLRNFHPTGGSPTTVVQYTGAAEARTGYFYVKVAKVAGPHGSSVFPSTFAVKAILENLGGECPMGYADCNVNEDSHPSSRGASSANDDSSRFRHCLVLPDDVTGIPTTRCAECASECDCHGGQYCHLDLGTCPDVNGGESICDAASYAQYGSCVAKDPAEKILGEGCRTSEGLTVSDLTALGYSRQYPLVSQSALLVAEDVGSALATDSTVSAGRFCGKALYYNNTPPLAAHYFVLGSRKAARAILWSGSCRDGQCHECDTGASTCGGSRTCIQGRWMDTVVVDNTVRTYTVNTVAGTMLGATMMIILLQICTCVQILQARGAKAAAAAKEA